MDEAAVRQSIYFAAVIRCFPGKATAGGDRVPSPAEIANCSSWLNDELELLRPKLVIPVGRLAISQFIAFAKLDEVVGRVFKLRRGKTVSEVIPLPHPSGASPWHKIPPGKQLLKKAMHNIARHAAIADLIDRQRTRS